MARPKLDHRQVFGSLCDFLIARTDVTFSEKKRLEDEYNITIEEEQLQMYTVIRDNNAGDVVISCARGVGKSWTTGVAIIDLARSIPDFYIGVCTPKEGQAQRLLTEAIKILKRAKASVIDSVDWRQTTNLRIVFKNGSFIKGFSAGEQTSSEGDHFHVVVNDESHLTSGLSLSQKIGPMLGSFTVARMVKIGVALYKNHFYNAIHSNSYKKVILDWTKSTRLKLSGVVVIDGKEYPKYAFRKMPLSLKLKLWPNLPQELQIDGDMTEEDFRTQYMIEWVDSISQLLTEADQKLFLDGTHSILHQANMGEVYYYGLDTAPGSLKPGQKRLDFTSLSICRKTHEGVKEKVFQMRWQGDPLGQIKAIRKLVHPTEGLFPCQFGLIDYSNTGIYLVEAFKDEGLGCEGIQYQTSAPGTGKNYKNAMVDYFLFELRSKRYKYPLKKEVDASEEFSDGIDEWFTIERRQGQGTNDIIEAPEGRKDESDSEGEADVFHDDIANSDFLSVYAADKGAQISAKAKDLGGYQIPTGIAGGVRSSLGAPGGGIGKSTLMNSPEDLATQLKSGQQARVGNQPWWKR
jgi:hypothetical protein